MTTPESLDSKSGPALTFQAHADTNPYRSPQVGDVKVWVPENPGAAFEATLVRSWSLHRRVRLTGRLEAEIEWDANLPIEVIRVNGKRVASKHAFFQCTPFFDFWLSCESRQYHVAVEVRVVWLYFTKAFRISVDGEAVYSEGKWPISLRNNNLQ